MNAFLQFYTHQETMHLWFRFALGWRLVNGQAFRRRHEMTAHKNKKIGSATGQRTVGIRDEVRNLEQDHLKSL